MLFISHSSLYRGAEKSLLLLLKHIDREKIRPVFLSPANGPMDSEVSALGIPVYHIPFGRWIGNTFTFIKFIVFFSSSIPRIRSIVKKEQIHLVYSNTMVVLEGALVAKMMKLPHIWHLREIVRENPNLKALFGIERTHRMISKLSTKIIAISNAVAQSFVAHNPVSVIKNATDLNHETHQPNSDLNKTEVVKTKGFFTVGVLGDIIERKGQHLAIKALKIILKDMPNVQLVFAGNDKGRYASRVKKATANNSLENRVRFLGYVINMKQLIEKLDITWVLSWEEPFGRVTIESMALGVPVIGTRSGGTAEIIQDGQTGYLVEPGDYRAVAEKTLWLFHNPALKSEMGHQARKEVQMHYSPETYVSEVSKVIHSC